MERRIIITSDGSHSLFVPELNEHYHSTHGAIQESRHVFTEAGLTYFLSKGKRNLSILEIGMGTGLNALLTGIESINNNLTTHYSALEAFPISSEQAAELNYGSLLSKTLSGTANSSEELFKSIHSCEWEKEIRLTDSFIFVKYHNTLQRIMFHSTFDLIYYDAFGPPVQPEMWTDEIFQKIFGALNEGGCLVTYCAKGEVKRVLKRSGFIVESLAGPPGKREMVRALKP